MEMLSPEAETMLEAANARLRPLKRVEYERLVTEGFFEDEKVELLFGMVVEMAPIDPAHCESVARIHEMLLEQLKPRARVLSQASFAASDESEPEPDVYVVPSGTYWSAHPQRAFLIVEVARSSLRRDRAKRLVYGRADVDEYWIVNHVDGCVEVYRDRRGGTWHSVTTHVRGEVLSLVAFPDVRVPVDEILPPL